jgi:hypothetical protein
MNINLQATDRHSGTKMELAGKEMFMLFPTPLFTGKLIDLSACDRIEKTLRDMQKLGTGMASQAKAAAYMTQDQA